MLYNISLSSERLKELRLKHGYTMQDIAKKIDLKSHGTYSDIEHGKNIWLV